MFVWEPKFWMGQGMVCLEVHSGAGLSAQQQQQPGLGARPQGSAESRSGAKPGEEKAPDPLGCSAGAGARCLYIN